MAMSYIKSVFAVLFKFCIIVLVVILLERLVVFRLHIL